MTPSYHHPADVLRFVAETPEPCALITVSEIYGGAMRAKGALMAVTQSGEAAGYISNGCVDADIILQAQAALAQGKPRRVHYGESSPYKDIVLPCGGAIHLVIAPAPEGISVNLAELEGRKATTLTVGGFTHDYSPKLRLRIAGRGAGFEALAALAVQSGFEVHMQSPELVELQGVASFEALTNPVKPPKAVDDSWTAVVLMFHDHDWETALLRQALAEPAFYIGAMGSARTHELRLAALGEAGEAARIHAPIGLIPAMRDANLLALSTLAEIVSVAQKKDRL